MSGTWLLRPGDHLNGVRAVTTRIRPAKLAFAIPDDDPRIALRAVQSCCSAWGGYAYVIVPCSRNTGLSRDWKAVLWATDPDAVVDCGVLSEEDKEELERRDLSVRDWRDADEALYLGEALQRSALAAFGEWLDPSESEHFVVVAELSDNDPLYLPVLARWGALDDAALGRAVRRLWYEYRDLPVGYSAFARLRPVDFSGHPTDALLGRVPARAEGESDAGLGLKLPDLTRIGLAASGPAWAGGGTPEEPQLEEGYADFVVVTGEADSVPDLALYWNLRNERLGAEPFPLWLPLNVLDGERGEALVEEAVGMTNPGIRRELPKGSQLYILSASASQPELEALLSPRFPDAVVRTERLSDFFTGRWKHYLTEEQAPVYFEDGSSRLPRPRPREFREFLPLLDRAVYELDIDGVRFPQSKAIRGSIFGNKPHRITKGGALEHLPYTTDRAPKSNLPTIQLPDGWTLLSALFEEHGYDCEPTQKSKLSLGQLSLLGGLSNAGVLSSSKVYETLKKLSGRRGEGREFATTERRTEALNYFDRAWGRDSGRELLRWLVERRVLLRGAELACPRCWLKRWYAVDRIGEVWRCDGCQEDMPIPLNPDATYWRYRINELFAVGYDQGTLLPLLVLRLLHSSWGTSSDKSGFGCYPGVELRAKAGASVPVEHVEIDLVALRHGRLLLFECKESGEQLNEPGETSLFAEQLSGLVAVADHLCASRVVNVTTTAFPKDKALLLSDLPREHAAEVEWWEGESILDPYPYTLGEERRPDGWPERYLDMVSRTLLEPR